MNILMSTNNPGKVAELSELLAMPSVRVLTLAEAGLELEVTEDGKTFAENAIKKAVEAYRASGIPAIGDDSGLSVKALSGRPGIYSARWAGEGATGSELIKKLFSELGEEKDREACFTCALALALSKDEVILAEGVCPGVIAYSPSGDGGFGYDPVFYVPEKGKTFAEMSREEKNEISHRARAIKELKKKLAEQNISFE